MTMNVNNRRRSLSTSELGQSDTQSTSSLWSTSSNKSKGSTFLSRFMSPSTNTSASTCPVSPTTSASTNILSTLPPIHGQQKIKRKPVHSPPTPQSTTSTQPQSRKKYEAVLGVKAEDLVNEDSISKKKITTTTNNNLGQGSVRGFGNLFKRNNAKSTEKKEDYNSIGNSSHPMGSSTNIPAGNEKFEPLPPFHHHITQRQELKLDTLGPEIVLENTSMEDKPVLLSNQQVYKPQYHRYEVGEQPSLASLPNQDTARVSPAQSTNTTRWSNASTQKSTESYSIYSTFGSDSIYGENDSIDNVTTTASTSLMDIHDREQQAANGNDAQNIQKKNPARMIIVESSSEEEDDDDDDDDDDDESEDESTDTRNEAFVDATGMSQEDIERERIEARLSKRLSGGHFGSAGGLMVSIMVPSSSTSDTKKQRRKSRPPPEDVAQSMMNWKRHSGQGLLKFASSLEQQQMQQHANEQQPNKLAIPFNEETPSSLPPTVPEKDMMYQIPPQRPYPQRPLPPHPEILLSTTEEEEEEEEEEDEHEDLNDPKECAARLWYEDESFVEPERIAEWLGQSKPLNTSTLYEYMKYFDFATMRLDSAFRKVCSKLYFRAEAQQIDRILEAFAKRYWECNPKTIFGSADIVYAVVYSLLLLNTDLHVAQGSYTRMTRQAFVKNTMSTIRDQYQAEMKSKPKSPNFILAWEAHVEAYLKDMYVSVKNYQILQPTQHQQQNDLLSPTCTDNNSLLSASSSKRMSVMGGKRMIDIKRSLNTMIHKTTSARESILVQEDPVPRKSTSSTHRQQYSPHSPRIQRRDSFTSNHSINNGSGIITSNTSSSTDTNGALLSPNQSHIMNFMDIHSEVLFSNHPPYLKEGVVMRKHLLESANQKAKHREWKECLLVVTQGQLKMYGLQSDSLNDTSTSSRRNMLRASSASFANLADSLSKNGPNTNAPLSYSGVSHNNSNNSWAAYSQLIGSLDLNHSLSNALPPPGYNRTRPHVFAIQQPNGGVYLIQAASNEQVMEWVSTCNYWAARQSKEPLLGGVSNIEYGWGSCLDDVVLDLDAIEKGKKIIGKYTHDPDTVNVSAWVPPAPTMISSKLDEKTQLDNLQKYVDQLNGEINEHREIKKKIQVKFHSKCQNHARALANWESKSKYMLHEIIKYQNYCNALEDSLARREKDQE